MINFAEPDLMQHPPRSPRARLGGFAHLPRLLDKARATLAGKNGDYVYGAMMDRQFFAFAGIDSAAFLDAVKTGRSDTEMLAWVVENLRPSRVPSEIAQWSACLETHAPANSAGHAWFAGKLATNGPQREDIRTYCEHLDLDDPPLPDRECHDRELAPVGGHDQTRGAVDERRPRVRVEPPEHECLRGHGRRATHHDGGART